MIVDFDYLPLPAIPESAANKNNAAQNNNSPANRARHFARLDENSDGSLTFEEFGKGRKAEEASRLFKLRDLDKNNSLSREEFLPAALPQMSR